MYLSNKFQAYDYGEKENMKHYNQTNPPEFDLSQVKMPVALYSSLKDWLADYSDVEYIRQNLPNLIQDKVQIDWDHLDFVWALNSYEIYNDIINLMKKN